MKRILTGVALLTLTFVLLSCASASQRGPAYDPVALARGSSFVFVGTIEKLRASTLSIPEESGTAVVRVDRIIDATPDLRSLGGKEVTMRLLRPGDARIETTRIFFTEPYAFGRTVGLTENGSAPPGEVENVERDMAEARQRIRDAALADRLRTAQRVVVARVVGISPAPEFERNREAEASEHNPEWHVARLDVSQTLKGEHSEQATVRFAASRDVMWFGTPKLEVGQEAIFLLEPNQMKEFPTDGPIVVDPLDVQDLAQRSRVERLLGARTDPSPEKGNRS